MDRLVCVNDNDSGNGNTSVFSNVKIYEGSCLKSATSEIVFGTKTPMLGDEDEVGQSMITITPNHTADSFILGINNSSKNINASIYSIVGRKITEVKLKSGNNTISTRNLALQSGIYLIKVIVDGEELTV